MFCGNTMKEACKDHDNNLHGLLERARKIGLRFNSAEMLLRQEEVRCLGHLILGDGLKRTKKGNCYHENGKANRYKIKAAIY